MRRHAKASSARSNARKPSGLGSSPPSGRLRLTILLATVAAFLLVPAAQAFGASTMTVFVEGTGSGEASSVGGIPAFGGAFEGSPPIECSYTSPGPTTGVCEDEATPAFGQEGVALHPIAASGSEFVEWIYEGLGSGCPSFGIGEAHECRAFVPEGTNTEWLATAVFCPEGEPECAAPPSGPTNRRLLTVTKSAGGSGGVGSVKSKPKGINCATACNKAVGSFYEDGPTPSNVVLTAKPATGSTFTEWTGACSGSELTCTVSMSEDKEVGAVFGGTSKAIINPQALTVTKDESTGFGTVKGKPGLACEAECTETTVLYQGPEKPKTVELSALAAFGSEFVEWGGACSGSEPTCSVTMTEAKEVTATFAAKPTVGLTVSKNTAEGNYSSGTGTVTSKPKGIKCAALCTTQTMSVPTEEAILLKAKAATGMTFSGWGGVACSSETVTEFEGTCTVSLAEAGTVIAEFSGSPKAIANPQALTLAKAGSGFGTVKAAGITCEALCTSATSLYQGPEKPKVVVLVASSALGSKAVVWSGCDAEPAGNCEVTMTEAKNVTATFDELP